jgi:predicted transposase/invertase (TIGR01784 family)
MAQEGRQNQGLHESPQKGIFAKKHAMLNERSLISFDWALKRRAFHPLSPASGGKANFGILEGFLSVLLGRDITVRQILESEGNQDEEGQKINRVDILVEEVNGELVIIELQYSSELDYFYRMLFATSKALTNFMEAGAPYHTLKKVYSINLLYFDLGQGEDYVYRGTTSFTGLHHGDTLQLSLQQRQAFGIEDVYQLYPEYYVIKINEFDDVAKDSLDEWIYYFKHSEVKQEFTARGLDQVREHMRVARLSKEERRAYERHLEQLSSERSVLETARREGEEVGLKKGEQIGMEKGERKKALETACKLKAMGFATAIIAEATGLSIEEGDGLEC